MKKKRGVPALEWLCDLSGQTARITSIGNRTLLVENHRGIIEFSGERIVLATGCGSVSVEGENLLLTEVRRDALVIRGDVRHVQLPCGEAVRHEP
ncbi:MAG: YabP/YqfC family sporulation protein [Clostridia bacterium]|nr:YabP/YqfC family sporulation protein [Clostridia bacterium]